MPPLTKDSVAWNGLLPSLASLITDSWRPGVESNEAGYRDSLLTFLRGNVPSDARVEREYRHQGTTTDLFLHWQGHIWTDEIFIEIKRNLKSKPTYDRLIGQLETLKPTERKILVVLVGDTEPSFLGRLREHYASRLSESGGMRIVVVATTNIL